MSILFYFVMHQETLVSQKTQYNDVLFLAQKPSEFDQSQIDFAHQLSTCGSSERRSSNTSHANSGSGESEFEFRMRIDTTKSAPNEN